jgi:imidazole glycerol-phosphate synthase subunit HisF
VTLARRIIPTMLVRGRTLVKGKQFAGDRSIGHAQQAARVHAMRGVDELLILDIGATAEGRRPDLGLVSELSAGCFIPITVGGGVKTIEDVDALLRAGADKVAVCSVVQTDPTFVSRASDRFGSQAITVVVEHDDDEDPTPTVAAALNAQNLGAGEIVVQSRQRDGVMPGYALPVIEAVANLCDVPVIASGGCSGYPDMLEALKRGASGVAAGALFAFTDATPLGAARYLRQHGMEVRL